MIPSVTANKVLTLLDNTFEDSKCVLFILNSHARCFANCFSKWSSSQSQSLIKTPWGERRPRHLCRFLSLPLLVSITPLPPPLTAFSSFLARCTTSWLLPLLLLYWLSSLFSYCEPFKRRWKLWSSLLSLSSIWPLKRFLLALLSSNLVLSSFSSSSSTSKFLLMLSVNFPQ